MAREQNFTFRVSDRERRMIARLSDRLERSQGDAIRYVIRHAVNALDIEREAQMTAESPNKDRMERTNVVMEEPERAR